MIPSIEEIVRMLGAQECTEAQAVAWMNEHVKLAEIEKDTWVHPSDKETDAAGRAALASAAEAMAFSEEELMQAESTPAKLVPRIIEAFVAVDRAEKRANQEFDRLHPGRNVHSISLDAVHICATALEQARGHMYEDAHPYAVGALPLVAFAQAVAIVAVRNHVNFSIDLLTDEEPPFYGDAADLALIDLRRNEARSGERS